MSSGSVDQPDEYSDSNGSGESGPYSEEGSYYSDEASYDEGNSRDDGDSHSRSYESNDDDGQASQEGESESRSLDEHSDRSYDENEDGSYADEDASYYSNERDSREYSEEGRPRSNSLNDQHDNSHHSHGEEEDASQYSDERGEEEEASYYSDERGEDEEGSYYSDEHGENEDGSYYSDERGEEEDASNYSGEGNSNPDDEENDPSQSIDEGGSYTTNSQTMDSSRLDEENNDYDGSSNQVDEASNYSDRSSSRSNHSRDDGGSYSEEEGENGRDDFDGDDYDGSSKLESSYHSDEHDESDHEDEDYSDENDQSNPSEDASHLSQEEENNEQFYSENDSDNSSQSESSGYGQGVASQFMPGEDPLRFSVHSSENTDNVDSFAADSSLSTSKSGVGIGQNNRTYSEDKPKTDEVRGSFARPTRLEQQILSDKNDGPTDNYTIASQSTNKSDKRTYLAGNLLGESSGPVTLTTMLAAGKGSELPDGERSVDSKVSNASASSRRSRMQALVKSTVERPTGAVGYTREQIKKLIELPRNTIVSEDDAHLADEHRPKKNRKRSRIKVKSEALLDFASKVNEAMIELDKHIEAKKGNTENKAKEAQKSDEDEEEDGEALSTKVLQGFERIVGILLRLSDEYELLCTFAKSSDRATIDGLKTLLGYTGLLDDIFGQLEQILLQGLNTEMSEEMEDFLYGVNLTVEQVGDLCYRVAEKQQWNARANTSYLTLLELLGRDTLEITCIYDDVDTPAYTITQEIQSAWEATGHDEEATTLLHSPDLTTFRQICYEVLLSCDQWCPDTEALMDICAIEDDENDETPAQPNDDELVPPPEAALQVLEKINGEFLTRIPIMASVLRRILPPEVVTDTRMKDSFPKIRNPDAPAGLSPSTLVSVTSIPEDPDDEESLGVAGVGKTTIAAMVANHPDVRRFFHDGIAWVYIGPTELNYTRYVQCLQDLIGQLEVEPEEEPLFPELLHTPGESKAKRRRREEGFMVFVKETMVEFLEQRNVLIILDDVCFDPDLDWFDFTPQVPPEEEEGSCVTLATSRRRNLLPAADTVEVEMLEHNEAVKLLVRESGALMKVIKPESAEINSVVVECAHHALAVKSLGRWLNLKHAPGGSPISSAEEIQRDVVQCMQTVTRSSTEEDADMMFEILNMSLSPAIDGHPTIIIKFCFAAFVKVFCDRSFISDFALADSTPIVPLSITEQLFDSLIDLEEEFLRNEGSLANTDKRDAAALIPEALSSLGVFKVIITFVEEGEEGEEQEEKYYQIMHKIQEEYGEFLYEEEKALSDLVKDGERRWNRAFAESYLSKPIDWDTEAPDAGLDYALETIPSHMFRGGMLTEAAQLLCNSKFVRGRLFALGRENGTRRQIKDCESLFELMMQQKGSGKNKFDPKGMLKKAYSILGDLLYMDEDDLIKEEGSPEAVEVGRSHFDIGFSLAEKRCWEAAISHWDKSQELLVSALGLVELVAAVLFNVGVVYAEMSEYEQALGSLKQCLKIRGAIHGEEHILYAQTIQKIGDVFLSMSDYHEAMESYNWALDVMHIEPSHYRIDIGDILENMGKIHYSKGEIEEALQCFQDALRSQQVDLGDDHPELATTFHHIGNCLSDQGKTEEAIAHFEEAIRLKSLDPEGGGERDADILTIEGMLHNLRGRQGHGLECYEKALQVLVTKVPHRKEKVASLLHLIGCVYLMSGEHKKAMKLFEESLHARRKVLGFVHLDVASTLFNMAFLHQCRNRLDKALKCLEEALKIRQLRLPDSEKVAVTHEKIGSLARLVGKTKKAEIAFGEALRIRKIVHGENHEAVATVLQELGDLMDDLGEYDSAMKNYVQALEIRESRLGPDDLAVAETYYSMGYTLQKNQASDRALQCFEESLSIRKFQLGDDSKEVGDTLNMMGYLQAQRSELDDAISLLWESLRIRKQHEDHIKVSETLKNIGNVHREKAEYDLAVECYEECLRIRRAELGDNHEKLADALIAMGNVQSDMNATSDAMESYKEALTIRIRIFGEQDESVAAVLQYMGTLEFRAAELDRAYQLLDEFIRIRQENGTEPDGDYVNVLFMIGNIHKMQGNEEEAQKCWTEAYGVFQELGLAEGNPQIAEVMGTLVKEAGKGKKKRRAKTKSHTSSNADDELQSQKASGMFGLLAGKIKGGGRRSKGGHQLS
ncbi:kinesin light chain [Fistulifera solaris]|uniref:Kinesin light chain n=1 Tax=Fistulifera solaris TaxID=1519565 RepID=A0A1Z5JB72_FISSO|nr:kinesin light chain [Fistulifera solaris]|eukprot:GAX11253.1 kinesin light chain [Fistulifera solaris]